ncbi:unnamed protein product [Scytosiphon promiscuus]
MDIMPSGFNNAPDSTTSCDGMMDGVLPSVARLLLLIFTAGALLDKGLQLLKALKKGARMVEVAEGPARLEGQNRPQAQEAARREEAEEQEPSKESQAEDEAMPAGRPGEDEDEDERGADQQAVASAEQQQEPIHQVAAAALRSRETSDTEKARARRSNLYRKVLDKNLCSAAAFNGDLRVLKLARADKCPWDARTCNWAAKAGHIEVLQWARGGGCPWGEQTCYEAAWGGHLNVLAWAIETGCPWSKDACERVAKQNANHHVLTWIHANSSFS